MKTKYLCLIFAFCLVLGGCSKKATAQANVATAKPESQTTAIEQAATAF